MRLCARVSIEERIVTGCVCLTGCVLPFCSIAGIIGSSVGLADNVNGAYPHNKIYTMCAILLLIISVISCLCFSCSVVYKLRQHSWAKRKYLLDTAENDIQRDSHHGFERHMYTSILTQASLPPPPTYPASGVDSVKAREFLFS